MEPGNPESLVENPVVAQIAAESEDKVRQEASKLRESDDPELHDRGRLLEEQAPIVGELRGKVAQLAVENNLVLPLTKAEVEELEVLSPQVEKKMGDPRYWELTQRLRFYDNIFFNEQDDPVRQEMRGLMREADGRVWSPERYKPRTQ